MPRRACEGQRGSRSVDTVAVTGAVRMAPGAIGKVVCTKDFHCVKARDAVVFYKVLAQLK